MKGYACSLISKWHYGFLCMTHHLEKKSGFWSLISKLTDKTILFSLNKVGYFIHQHTFMPNDLDHSMQGKTCLVTGGNSGIGKAVVKALALRGAEVYMLCRNKEKGLVAVDELREKTKNHHIHLESIDVSNLDSIQKFLKTFKKKKVDVLIHNAGLISSAKKLTQQNIEITFATSVLGPYCLTLGLMEKLSLSEDARVIFVSSGGAYTQKLNVKILLEGPVPYSGLIAYAQCKRAQIVLAEMLAEKLQNKAIGVHVMHPGWADTPGVRISLPRFSKIMRYLLRTPDQGADTAVWLAVNPELKEQTGKYWFDRRVQPTHLLLRTKESLEDRNTLWQLCEKYCNFRI